MPETRTAVELCDEDGPSEVLVTRGAARDSDNKTIHVKTCRQIRQRGREKYRSVAPEILTSEWTVCRWCSDAVDADSGSYGNQTCPFCGDTVTKLPDHLRHHCDGGEDGD